MTANVLVVDDLEANVKLLQAKLLREYYTVFTASSGKSALEILAHNKIDVVLLDVMMPEMDGFETCKKIKANPNTLHIPIVMVTALSEKEDRIKGLEAGADEFLTKPINDTALFARVRSLSRMKAVIDTLKLRNTTNEALGLSMIDMKDTFEDTKILLINDDITQAGHVKEMLRTITNQVRIVEGLKQLENYKDYIPDLVIISCHMANTSAEDNDPLRISVALRANEELNEVVLILAVEEEDANLINKALEIGINDYYIVDQTEQGELVARIKTQLRRKQYQDNLRNNLTQSMDLSVKDGLTGLFNRRYFDVYIIQMTQKASETKRPLCLLMCDIDDFKQVNDTYGHQAGDIVLKTFTGVLNDIFRVTDLIARFGGEEFVVVLNDTTLEQAEHIAERVRIKIEDLEFEISQSVRIKKTISIGVAWYQYGEEITDFIERSDKALYIAKTTGKNKVQTTTAD